MSAYLIKISDDEYGWLKKVLGPFADFDAAERFRRTHGLPSYREEGREWHVIAPEACDQSPDEYHAEWAAESAELWVDDEVDDDTDPDPDTWPLREQPVESAPLMSDDPEEKARTRLKLMYGMTDIRQDSDGTWWIGSELRPDLLNMESLTAAAQYLDGLPSSMVDNLARPRGSDSEQHERARH